MKLYFILAAILISFLVGAGGGYYFEKSGIPAKLTDQQATDKKECEQAQQVTKEANDALQKNRDIISAQLDALKLQHPATCVRIARPAKLSSGGAEYANANGNGLSSDWLRSYAAKCEEYRGEVTVCTTFLSQERDVIQPTQ